MGKSGTDSFDLLSSQVKQWVWKQGWSALKDIQERTIPLVLSEKTDVIVCAATAGGKTEAVFLPILSKLCEESSTTGYSVLYISPLRALINDQAQRLTDMTKGIDISITPWHKDVALNKKERSIKNPAGILIITPESLESMLARKSEVLQSAFMHLRYIVVDELHSFIGAERGIQLQSLMSRMEAITQHHIPRIAMSATLSNLMLVKHFLRPNEDYPCNFCVDDHSTHEVKLQIKEYLVTPKVNVLQEIAKDLFTKLRGTNNLVFTNSRDTCELLSNNLGQLSECHHVPNEFWAHHGNISKEWRERIETELKIGRLPVTTICTSTLELGIDIGKVKSIAQIGCALSVSGLRQRLGRSGRRNEPSVLRIYSVDYENEHAMSGLRFRLVQNIAAVELLKQHQYEAPHLGNKHLSTLIQQTLSLLMQYGGLYAKDLWLLLCECGPFKISAEVFKDLLHALGAQDVLTQTSSGILHIGKKGSQIVERYDFYTAFNTNREFSVVDYESNGLIGTLQRLPEVGSTFVLAGRCWEVMTVNARLGILKVSETQKVGDLYFENESIDVDAIITSMMKKVYESTVSYDYLDSEAVNQLIQARKSYFEMLLNTNDFVRLDKKDMYFTWAGSRVNRTIALIAKKLLDVDCSYDAISVRSLTYKDVARLIKMEKPDGQSLAPLYPRWVKERNKYDYLLTDQLLDIEFASSQIDVDGAWRVLMQ
jgi:ATP-dependent Lhr-like helicase